MLDYEQTEQESLENLSRWWKRHGKTLILAVVGVSLLYLGWTAWQSYIRAQHEKVSSQFSVFLSAFESGEVEPIESSLKLLQEEHANSVYADMASLLVAKTAVDAQDFDEAKHHLRWVIEHSHQTPTLPLAQTRLARLLIDQKAFEEAMLVLNAVREDTGYKTVAEELKGDIYAFENKWDEAKKAYSNAMMAGPDNAAQRPWLKMKLDDISVDDKVVS